MGLYCGIDLHSNNHMLMVIDDADRRVYERRLPNDLAITKAALEPYRADLVAVAVESTFNWYWLVDGLIEAIGSIRRGSLRQWAAIDRLLSSWLSVWPLSCRKCRIRWRCSIWSF